MPDVYSLLEEATDIEDPAERVAFIHEKVLPAVNELRRAVIAQRSTTAFVASMENSQRGLAKRLGVSRPLVQQLIHAGEALIEAGEDLADS